MIRLIDKESRDAFIADQTMLTPTVILDRPNLPDVTGKTMLHLQCNHGGDTLSWARLGVDVTGVDINGEAIEKARELAQTCAIEARFIESDIHLLHEVLDQRFDIVYTSLGALCWIAETGRWAQVIAHFLKPGGTFYLREYHPIAWMLNLKQSPPAVRFGYFETEAQNVILSDTCQLYNHGVAETAQALITAGLSIEAMAEETQLETARPWVGWPLLPVNEAGWHTLLDNWPDFPLSYRIRATL